jgi:5-histidylcysteine sulfoxide synthase
MKSLPAVELNTNCLYDIQSYFNNTWTLYEWLFRSIKDESCYYIRPDPLRHPLIFYLGHTAAFYVNTLKKSGLLKRGVNKEYEYVFAAGVDPENPAELLMKTIDWPEVKDVWEYRTKVYNIINNIIKITKPNEQVSENHSLWALFMGIEHERIHFETSSVLLRQCPTKFLQRPNSWRYAPVEDGTTSHTILYVPDGKVILGKKNTSVFGWDNEYGLLEKHVSGFYASQNLITNELFLDFINDGGYAKEQHWSQKGWEWKQQSFTKHPKFLIKNGKLFNYRALFDVLALPLQWPAEVNYYEAEAFCNWQGDGWRLMTEFEYRRISDQFQLSCDDLLSGEFCNINLKFFSPSPVGLFSKVNSASFNDIYGNVWEWINTDFYPLPGFNPHPYYFDFSLPYFGKDHLMMLGGSWASTGTSALPDYRLWFRKHFFQHAGFRIARSENL